MGINQSYREGFLAQVIASMNDEVTYIPNFLSRVNEVFNLMQSRYVLIFGATGIGKTAFADYLFVLAPWTYLKSNEPDVHWEVQYFSLERKAMFKHAKWMAWLLHRDLGEHTSSDELMGWGAEAVSKDGYQLIRSYDEEVSELLEHVHIYDGKRSVDFLGRVIQKRARQLGILYHSDENHVYIDDDDTPIASFSDDNVEITKTETKRYVDLEHDDVKFRLYEEDHRYFLFNPKTFVFFVIDGIGLFAKSDFSSKKSTLDEVSAILADARDYYGFSPVIISQQNRELGSTARLKLHGSDMSPRLEDVEGSSRMAHDSDLALALFDPFHYKAYDTKGRYGGYDILQGMMSPRGFSRFRSLHVVKNTFGYAGKVFGLKFLGECNDFTTLPYPDDDEIDKIYAEIARIG